MGQILKMKRQGQNIFKHYLSSPENILDTTLATIFQKIGLEPRFYKVSAFTNNGLSSCLPNSRSICQKFRAHD